jgi:hypothetical protein
VALALVTSCGQRGPAPSAVVRAYFNAYNSGDGQTMCDNFTPQLRSWFEREVAKNFFGRDPSCAAAAVGMIRYVEDAGFAKFKHLEVLSTEEHVDGAVAEVDVRARYRYKASNDNPENPINEDKIYLVRHGGRWLITKPGAVYFETQSASSPPSSMTDPPIPGKGSSTAAPQPPARFECSTKLVGDVTDKASGAPASLDIRRAWASVNSDGSECLGFAFASQPRPGTELYLEIMVEAKSGGQLGVEPYIRIGAGGSIYGLDELPPGSQAGWRDGELLLRWPAPKDAVPGQPFSLRAETKSLQIWEPMIKHPISMDSEDTFEADFGLYKAESNHSS